MYHVYQASRPMCFGISFSSQDKWIQIINGFQTLADGLCVHGTLIIINQLHGTACKHRTNTNRIFWTEIALKKVKWINIKKSVAVKNVLLLRQQWLHKNVYEGCRDQCRTQTKSQAKRLQHNGCGHWCYHCPPLTVDIVSGVASGENNSADTVFYGLKGTKFSSRQKSFNPDSHLTFVFTFAALQHFGPLNSL